MEEKVKSGDGACGYWRLTTRFGKADDIPRAWRLGKNEEKAKSLGYVSRSEKGKERRVASDSGCIGLVS